MLRPPTAQESVEELSTLERASKCESQAQAAVLLGLPDLAEVFRDLAVRYLMLVQAREDLRKVG